MFSNAKQSIPLVFQEIMKNDDKRSEIYTAMVEGKKWFGKSIKICFVRGLPGLSAFPVKKLILSQ